MERIDLSTNGKAIGAAYDEIRNATSSNTWVVFGYDGKSPTIVVREKGDDWDELVDEMSASRILYAYIRVLDPNTNLHKFVVVNWSGEGVPSNIKGPRAYHIPDMERLLHTKHVTIHARNEDDLDEKVVKDKVAKSSGSNYSFHKEKAKQPDTVAPVASVYAKTNAEGEITSSGRSKFWQRQDTEERGRIQDDNERLTRTRSEAERYQKERDSSESSARNQRVDARQRTIDSQKVQEKDQWNRAEEDRKRREQDQFESVGRELTQEKESATHQVPSYRQEASTIQSSAPIPEYATQATPPMAPMSRTEEPVRTPMVPVSHIEEAVRTPMRPPLPQEVDDSPSKGYEAAEPDDDDDLTYDTAENVGPVESQDIYDDVTQQPGYPPDESAYDEIGDTLQGMQVQEATPQAATEDIYDEIDIPAPVAGAVGFSVRAIYDYTASEEGEISFDPGDIITNVDPIDEGWWQGTAPNGEYGLFPATYVETV